MVTYREALEDMLTRKRMVQAQCESCWTEEAEMTIKALEKQVPMKPYLTEQHVRCTVCRKMITKIGIDRKLPLYCSRCGQRIAWSEI